jgi:hypothetical protein
MLALDSRKFPAGKFAAGGVVLKLITSLGMDV